ncbi:MAG: hypothetical protein IPO65_01880 [Saprospiraceae bacterium]|nr:hypothetical protein [Saprospiraceae bacterium]
MKKILTLVLSCLPPFLFSQQPFPLEFKGYGAMWQKLITNGDGKFSGQTESIFTTVQSVDIADLDSVVYVLYQTRRNSQIDRVIIDKLNPKSGELLWRSIDNSYTGNEHFQKYWKLFVRPDDKLELIGFKARENAKSFAPNVCLKKYDSNSGKAIYYQYDTTDISYGALSNDPVFPIFFDSLYLAANAWRESSEVNPKQGYQFYIYNHKLELNASEQLITNSPSVSDSFGIDQLVVRPLIEKISDHILACIFIHLNEVDNQYETRAELVLIDCGNPYDIKVLSRTQFGDEIYDWPDEDLYYRITSYSDEVQLCWRYPKLDTITDKLFMACSFLALDTAGNVVARVDDVAQNDHWIYNLRCAGKLQDNYYLLGHRSDDRASFDIMEVDSESRAKLLVSVVTADRPSNDGFNGFNTVQKITKDSLFIFSGALFTKGKKMVPGTTSTHYTMAFDLRQWMRPTASEEVVKDLTIKLYPNPSHEYLNIEVPDIKGKLHFYASNGVLLKTISINGSQSMLVDTSVFPVGVNVIMIEPAEKTGVVRSVTFVKM